MCGLEDSKGLHIWDGSYIHPCDLQRGQSSYLFILGLVKRGNAIEKGKKSKVGPGSGHGFKTGHILIMSIEPSNYPFRSIVCMGDFGISNRK